ncbi:MAG TPA: XRE family transcriptional regulator [Rhizomicrobium sp.]|jgi:Zn-dependent peptidase ImmA (M78 family)
MNIAQTINQRELGERLRNARETAKITQADAAVAIDMSRTTLVAIEKGERRVRIEELQALAGQYNVSVNALLRREALHVDLVPRFRRLSDSTNPDVDAAARLMNDLVSAEVELENLLGIEHPTNYPPERPIVPGDVREQAERDATWLRDYLGLGPGPIADIFSLMEVGLGIRVFQRKLPQKISGLFAYYPSIGASVLLNADHPLERRVQSAGHELGHFTGTRGSPEVLEKGERFLSREERYAHAFGRAFLTPATSTLQKFRELTAGASHLTRRHVILLAHYFGVSREAMVRRLEELKLAREGTWQWFEVHGKITDQDARKVVGDDVFSPDSARADARRPVSLRLGLMALEAWRRELLSEGQLCNLLKIDRITLRTLLYDLQNDEGEANELLKLPR